MSCTAGNGGTNNIEGKEQKTGAVLNTCCFVLNGCVSLHAGILRERGCKLPLRRCTGARLQQTFNVRSYM